MAHELSNTIAILAHTPAALDGLLRGLPEMWTDANEGEGTWTSFDVLKHLIEADRVNWMPRARHILTYSDNRPFEPFDRSGGLYEGKETLPELLDAFAQQRGEKVADLRAFNLTMQDLELRGVHPALGEVTLSQLLATWAVHDLTHLHQITRVFASQYRETVGPWKKFLGVLQCTGHSEPA